MGLLLVSDSMAKRAGFTLLELCLAFVIGLLIVTVALPSLGSLFAEQRLVRTFEKLDGLARTAQRLSMHDRKTYEMVWDRGTISLRVAGDRGADVNSSAAAITCAEDEGYEIDFPAALIADPPKRWTFWPTGTCEPANIAYHGSAGSWSARYDPLTVRGAFLASASR